MRSEPRRAVKVCSHRVKVHDSFVRCTSQFCFTVVHVAGFSNYINKDGTHRPRNADVVHAMGALLCERRCSHSLS
jgi:hypothetical protein